MNVLLNADDFGKSSDVNRAILVCFRERLISSATIMANMPAFEDAVRLCFANNLVDQVGLHINLTEGQPLTEGIRDCPQLCDSEGRFIRKRHFRLSSVQQRLVADEVAAQIERCRRHGLQVTHVDSHHHSHTEPGKFLAMLPTLREYHVESVRISRNVEPLPPLAQNRSGRLCSTASLKSKRGKRQTISAV